MLGRVTRPLNHIGHQLNDIDLPSARRELIGSSNKPDSIVIDVVDIVGKHKLATLPTTLGLPAKLDLQGRKLTDAAKLVKEFEDVKKQVLYECPATYEELEAKLKEIDILTKSGAKHRMKWQVKEDGSYNFGKAPPGYTAVLSKEGPQWRLTVKHGQQEVLNRLGTPGMDVKTYFDKAAERAQDVIAEHRKLHPKSRGTLEWLRGWKNRTGEWAIKDMKRDGWSEEAIDALPKKAIWPLLQEIRGKKGVAYA